jgi:hypothetical protein
MTLKELQQRSRELKAAMTEERKAELRRGQRAMTNYLLLALMMAAMIAMDAYAADTPEAQDAAWASAIARVRVRLMQNNFQRGVIDSLLNAADPTGAFRGGSSGGSSGGGGGGGGGGGDSTVEVIYKNSNALRFAAGEFLGVDAGSPGVTVRSPKREGEPTTVVINVAGTVQTERSLRDVIIDAIYDARERGINV